MATTKVSALASKGTLAGSEEILINDGGTSKKSTVAGITLGGEVTGAVTAVAIANNVIDEANLKVSNSPTNGYFLSAQSGDTGGLTWAVGGSNVTTNGLWEHANTIAANYSIASGNNALTAGPITINSGVSVTVPTDSTWVVA